MVAMLITAAVAYLLVAYALGGPLVFARRMIRAMSRRRLRYRPAQDDALASSRFTIPVSVILYTEGEDAASAAAADLLTLNYPEFEVIVVNDGTSSVLGLLRERFQLSACEIFYRRALDTRPVRGIYRSSTDPRLLVLDCATETAGDALNCGVNLARYRYVCCADLRARYHRDALLESMHSAVEDPAVVVGVTTTIAPPNQADPRSHSEVVEPLRPTLERLSASRALLTRSAGRPLTLSGQGLAGFNIWRRDAVIEVGGFDPHHAAEQLELTFRMHRHHLREGRRYRLVHIAEPIGEALNDEAFRQLLSRQQDQQHALGGMLWRYRSLLLNPRYGYVGLIDLPRYLFNTLIVPWLELLCLAALPFAPLAGVLTGTQFLLVLVALGLGNAILLNTALLIAPTAQQDRTLRRFILLGPIELFVGRPVQLYWRLVGLVRMFAGPATPQTP
jgi:cellulose synthase/poly-beta-1,6-N-acetylglucosamine synthase-like glycosyltransferase